MNPDSRELAGAWTVAKMSAFPANSIWTRRLGLHDEARSNKNLKKSPETEVPGPGDHQR
ncbi:hypothetical protein [Burkholderia stagnalis]